MILLSVEAVLITCLIESIERENEVILLIDF
jgi:hypothetical protein